MKTTDDYSIRRLNTLGFESSAEHFVEVSSESELKSFLQSRQKDLPLTVLGGGSNIVCLNRIPGYLLKPNLTGISLLEENEQSCLVEAMAAEHWDNFVAHCVSAGWFGLENLSLIPGTVGASPIQNIGAYGVELKDVFSGLTALDLETGEERIFDLEQCQFGYRDSVFKNALKGRYVITRVRFRLSKLDQPSIAYRDLQLKAEASSKPVTADNVRDLVIQIRTEKLPDPNKLGNAGSFFKNAQVSKEKWLELKAEFPELPGYPQETSTYKIASAWMIDQLGWKGYRSGSIGVHDKQALVLIHNPVGGSGKSNTTEASLATGRDLLALADKIMQSVKQRFGVELEIEPNIIGTD